MVRRMGTLIEAIRENPKANNAELAELIGSEEDYVKTTIGRLKKKGFIEDIGIGNREFEVTKEPDVSKSDFKKEAYMTMIEAFLDDFENAANSDERIRLGQMIQKLLDRI